MFIPNHSKNTGLIVTLRCRLSGRPRFCSPCCNVDSFSPLAVISDYEAPHGHRLVWVDGIEWLAMGAVYSYYWFLVHSGSAFAAREAELLTRGRVDPLGFLPTVLPRTGVVQAHPLVATNT